MAQPQRPSAHFAEGETATNALLDLTRAELVAQDVALSIPSVRRAQGLIAGTISTFRLAGVKDGQRLPATDQRVAWLNQPHRTKTLQWLLSHTVRDLIWKDRCVWRVVDRYVLGTPVAVERINPKRISTRTDPYDDDIVEEWRIDGSRVDESKLVIFDGAGIGGLDKFGGPLLTLYGELQAAAGRYAKAPHPHAILKNAGADLDDDEIDALLAQWEKRRYESSVGYLNSVMDYQTFGYSARELQLTEARELAALEVARLFGLPATALDAAQPGSSMTYGNVVERRRDLLEAFRPWMTVIEQTLSLDDRRGRSSGTLLPHGITAQFVADAYTRDDAQTRMGTWSAGLDSGALTLDEVRAAEPLATGGTQ